MGRMKRTLRKITGAERRENLAAALQQFADAGRNIAVLLRQGATGLEALATRHREPELRRIAQGYRSHADELDAIAGRIDGK